jgi:hypothetical protein
LKESGKFASLVKQPIAILLLIIFSLSALKEITVFGLYHLNKEVIEEVFCVNKSKPELKCHGKCHMNAELGKMQDKESDEIPQVNIEDESVYFFQAIIHSTKTQINSQHLFKPEERLHAAYHTKIFHPPSFNA